MSILHKEQSTDVWIGNFTHLEKELCAPILKKVLQCFFTLPGRKKRISFYSTHNINQISMNWGTGFLCDGLSFQNYFLKKFICFNTTAHTENSIRFKHFVNWKQVLWLHISYIFLKIVYNWSIVISLFGTTAIFTTAWIEVNIRGHT